MTDQGITRSESLISTSSVNSFNSDDLADVITYSEAPWDIFGKADGIGRVLVAKKGDSLPADTKYKTTKGSNVAVRFR